jgi:histidinol-phosphate phosphatase family protein
MIHFDKNWTLFLDRDGVINERIPNDYVKLWANFQFMEGSLLAIQKLSKIFNRLIIVTNQAGIGKGIMTETQLMGIHSNMIKAIEKNGGRIDKIYHAPDHPLSPTTMRKPEIGMAELAKSDFPDIDFKKSVIVGDSVSDMQFGKKASMFTVFITGKGEDPSVIKPDLNFKSLLAFAEYVESYL